MVTRCFWKATGVLATAVVVATVSVVTAQSSLTTPTRANASSDELLTEVRGLRGDLQQAAKISIRAQLLVARLQLQEQRINVVGGQLTEIRRLIAIKESAQIPFAERLKGFDEALRSASISAEQYKDIESQIRLVKAQIAQMQKEARELRAQDAELSNQLTTEQGRWSDFNSRLDDLERMLPASQR
jgi:chromosome segregation ATPase